MQAKTIAAAAFGVAVLGWSLAPANAATCVRHSVFDQVGGHRTLISSETKCGVAPRVVHRAPRTVRTTRTVTDDYYVTTSRPYTTVRREYYSVPVTSEFDEEIYSGSSMPAPRSFWWGGY